MLAMNYRGPYRVRADERRMPEIQHPEDAIVRVTRSCICGSDLHLYHGTVPDTRVGMFGAGRVIVIDHLDYRLEFARSFDIVEGVVEDLGRGRVPNIPGEMGARAEWRHNRRGFVLKAGAALAAVALLRAAGRWRRSRSADAAAAFPLSTTPAVTLSSRTDWRSARRSSSPTRRRNPPCVWRGTADDLESPLGARRPSGRAARRFDLPA